MIWLYFVCGFFWEKRAGGRENLTQTSSNLGAAGVQVCHMFARQFRWEPLEQSGQTAESSDG